jgi:glycosyltransferase involved in cell wall biosynthesis
MVDKIYKQTDKILVTSPSFVESVVNRKVPVDRSKVIFWRQYAEEFYKPLNRVPVPEIPEDDCFKIAYTGNIGFAQGLSVLPRTAKILKAAKVKFVVVGGGRYQDILEKEIDELGVRDKFIMIPRQPASRVPELLAACDAGFISFQDDPLWAKTIPAKLQSYMACGKAIVASASGETKRVISAAECGVCCSIGDADALAEGIRQMLGSDVAEMGKRARSYFEANFDKTKLMDIMDGYIDECKVGII